METHPDDFSHYMNKLLKLFKGYVPAHKGESFKSIICDSKTMRELLKPETPEAEKAIIDWIRTCDYPEEEILTIYHRKLEAKF